MGLLDKIGGFFLGSGPQATQTADFTTNLASSVVNNVTQTCLAYGESGQTIAVIGSNNIAFDLTQAATITVDTNAQSKAYQSDAVADNVSGALKQTLDQQHIALMDFLDNTSSTVSTDITTNVTNALTNNNTQTCIGALNNNQDIFVSGQGNVVADVLQTATMNMLMPCMQKDSSTAASTNNVTNTGNQYSSQTSTNPLSFITDALNAMFRSAIVAGIVLLFLVLLFFGLVIALRRPRVVQAQAPKTGGCPCDSDDDF